MSDAYGDEGDVGACEDCVRLDDAVDLFDRIEHLITPAKILTSTPEGLATTYEMIRALCQEGSTGSGKARHSTCCRQGCDQAATHRALHDGYTNACPAHLDDLRPWVGARAIHELGR